MWGIGRWRKKENFLFFKQEMGAKMLGVFEIQSCKLFAQVDFELRFSQFLLLSN
jgi:hypothetical protein